MRIDRDTGQVNLERVVAVDDCATQINPVIVEGRFKEALLKRLARHCWSA